jgi:hypothetical protein
MYSRKLLIMGRDLQFHPDSAWKHETYQRRMHSRKLPMMGREDARNMKIFITE